MQLTLFLKKKILGFDACKCIAYPRIDVLFMKLLSIYDYRIDSNIDLVTYIYAVKSERMNRPLSVRWLMQSFRIIDGVACFYDFLNLHNSITNLTNMNKKQNDEYSYTYMMKFRNFTKNQWNNTILATCVLSHLGRKNAISHFRKLQNWN